MLQSLGIFAEGLWLHVNLINVAVAIFFVVVVGTGNSFIAQAKRYSNYKLGVGSQEEIEQLAALAERERKSRGICTTVLGHTLSLIVLKAELAGRLIERDPQH